MPKTMKQITIIIFSLGATVAIWATGWILYGKLELLQTIQNTEYQNILYATIGAEIIISMIAAAKTKQPLTELDKKQLDKMFKHATAKIAQTTKEHDSELAKLKETVADIRAAIRMAPETKAEATK